MTRIPSMLLALGVLAVLALVATSASVPAAPLLAVLGGLGLWSHHRARLRAERTPWAVRARRG